MEKGVAGRPGDFSNYANHKTKENQTGRREQADGQFLGLFEDRTGTFLQAEESPLGESERGKI